MEISKKVKIASKWSILTEVLSKLMAPITNMILARLLVPEDFGMVATITMVTSFADIFTDAGFQKYLVQHIFETEDELDQNTNVAFWTNLSLSVILWILIFVFRNLLATLVGNKGLGNAISIAAISLPLTSFSSIQMARFRRELDFKTIFYAKVLGILVPLVITIPLAVALKSFWALIIGNLAVSLSNAVLLTIKSKWKPKIYYNISQLKEMFAFSVWTLTEQILGWANLNIGIFIVGVFLSDYYLGIYKTSMATVNQVFAVIINALSPVLLSSLAKLKNDQKQFKDFFYQFISNVAMFCIPMGIGIFMYRKLFVSILLGNQWMEACEFVGLWGVMRAFLIVFGMFSMEVFVSLEKPYYSVFSQLAQIVLLIPTLLISSQYGYEVLIKARTGLIFWAIIIHLTLLYKVVAISGIQILKRVYPYLLSSISIVIIGFLTHYYFGEAFTIEIISVLICIVIYFGILMIFPSGKKNIINFVKSTLGRS